MTFREFCRSYGLMVHLDITPGKWQRCATEDKPRRRNGSFKLCEDERAGFCLNYATMTEAAVWHADRTDRAPVIDAKELESRRLAKERETRKAIDGAQRYYAACQPVRGSHPYLDRKDLTMEGCYGLRVDPENRLVIPLYTQGELVSVQRVAEDGEKLFWPGAPIKGAYYALARKHATITVFCEGLATGLTIFAACQEARVICAFSSGNLPQIVFKPPFGIAIVAADNDWKTAEKIGSNPGVDAAKKAADAIGSRLAIPRVADERHSDFNDLFAELLEKQKTNRMFSKWKCSDAKVRQLALAGIKSAILGIG